jgi:hypothetical protein
VLAEALEQSVLVVAPREAERAEDLPYEALVVRMEDGRARLTSTASMD